MATRSTITDPTLKKKGLDKLSRIPVKIETNEDALPKPNWIKIKLPSSEKVNELKGLLRQQRLHTVCEEASCPNLSECFSHGCGLVGVWFKYRKGCFLPSIRYS